MTEETRLAMSNAEKPAFTAVGSAGRLHWLDNNNRPNCRLYAEADLDAYAASARQAGYEAARAELMPIIERMRQSLKLGTDHSHHCPECGIQYTPDEDESEDCPNGCPEPIHEDKP